MTDKATFGGYKWDAMSVSYRSEETHAFHDSINWDALCQYASKLNKGEPCTMDSQTTRGGRNLVRILNFQNGTRWIARFRIPSRDNYDFEASKRVLQQEVDCMQLVKERTSVPVPTVFGYIASHENDIVGSFILTECLSGNATVNLQHTVPMSSEQRKSFYDKIAKFQAELSSITFPKIGSLARREDGTWEIGPLPGLGGPFDTAKEYLDAWADAAKFDDLERLEEMYGKEQGNRIKASILAFPPGLKKLAATIPVRNHGPFPLIHSDFALWNVVVDDNYKVLGVIDWEYAQSGPWEMVHFPTCFMPAPVPMGPSEWSGDAGIPDWLNVSFREMEEYVNVVRQAERAKNLSPTLSTVLSDTAGQDLAYAMRLYTVDGKHGYYARILEKHRERWGGGNKDSEAAQF